MRLWTRGRGLSPIAVLVALAAILAWMEQRAGDPPPRSAPAPAGFLDGTVATVHDGDTVTLRGDFGEARIRLGQIDAPELAQPWGRKSLEALRALAGGEAARLEISDVDGYGRQVGDLYVEGRHVNEELVREGHAWASTRWARDPGILEAQEDARRARRGLWSLPRSQREPPWDWRRDHPRRERGTP
jgi:endonuclease YncB( thermonuclease family)